MKLTESKCRIAGLMLGEAQLNFIRPDMVPIRAKVALVSGDDGMTCGYVEKSNGWSEKTMEALRALADAIEEDVLAVVFSSPEITPEAEKTDEPSQF